MIPSTKPRVTIGLPVFNGAKYLEQAIASIQSQSLPAWKLIIADNASTDESLAIAREAAAKDHRISVMVSERNRGAAWNYNRLVDVAETEFFRWAAYDDLLDPDYLSECVAALDHHLDAELAYPKTRIIDTHGNYVQDYQDNYDLRQQRGSDRFHGHLFSAQFECNAVFGLFRTEFLKRSVQIGSYPGSDFVLLGEAAFNGKIIEIPRQLFSRRDHEATSVRANIDKTDLQNWFGPKEKCGKAIRPAWTKLNRQRIMVWSSDLPFREKVRASVHLLRYIRWFWRDFAADYFPAFDRPDLRRGLHVTPTDQASFKPEPAPSAFEEGVQS